MKQLLTAALWLCISVPVWAGTVPPDSTIFPGRTARPLIDSLRKYYKTVTVLGYDNARDKMYGEIDITADSLTCVYSGWTIHGGPTAAPRTWTNNNDINCEHTWPQSLLDSSKSESDMHHLFPTEMLVNSDRGNYPFGDIPDVQTTYWYYNNNRTTSIPGSNIDWYAEYLSNTKFEPREVQKGNTARAMYYVLTMYQLGDTTATWWTGQRDNLYLWHSLDPADTREISRTRAIAAYQQNKVNPFVLDSTLIRRAYFPTMGVAGSPAVGTAPAALAQNSPNPFAGATRIRYTLTRPAAVQIGIYTVLGQPVLATRPMSEAAGPHTLVWDARAVPQGVYFYRLTVDGAVVATRRMTLVR